MEDRNNCRFVPVALGLLVLAVQPVFAGDLKTGEQVYAETCSACHMAGVAGAPKSGDEKAWAPLIEEGQAVVTAHGWVGVRAMPPRGGNPQLRLEEFARATAFMGRASGADWDDPDDEMMERIRDEEAKRIESLKTK